MSSREKILQAVRNNQPAAVPLPDVSAFKGMANDPVREYMDTFTGIGGKAVLVDSIDSAKLLIREQLDPASRVITTLPALADTFELYSASADPHSFENVELAVIRAHLAVCENGTVWLTEE